MLVVTSLGAIAFAGAMAGAAPRAAALPPIVVTVDVAVDLPPPLVSIVLQEAEAIWQPTGVTFIWRRTPRANAAANANPNDPCPPPTALRVTIGDDLGHAPSDRVPLGWIVFEGDDTPAHEIYVSHRNALEFMTNARGAARPIAQMPMAQQNLMLGRAMGRALAHEMGHYLLASKAHARRGLMQAAHTAYSFFEIDRSGFAIDKVMQHELAARLRHEPLTAATLHSGT